MDGASFCTCGGYDLSRARGEGVRGEPCFVLFTLRERLVARGSLPGLGCHAVCFDMFFSLSSVVSTVDGIMSGIVKAGWATYA